MSKKIQKWLLDIKRSVEAIQSFLIENPDFESCQNSLMLRRAIERELEITGEAVARMGISLTKLTI